jgi:hypothetical protein
VHPLRLPAGALGLFYFVAIVMLGPLLGSTADASSAFAEHFDDDGNRTRDLIGAAGLLMAAAMLAWTTVVAWRHTVKGAQPATRDLTVVAGAVSASTLVAASSLLSTVPLMSLVGGLTDDPGLDADIQAGIAQAGAVMLLVAALCLAVTTVLLARLGRQSGTLPRWMHALAWVTALTLCLGVTVVMLLPFAAWAIAFGSAWSSSAPRRT